MLLNKKIINIIHITPLIKVDNLGRVNKRFMMAAKSTLSVNEIMQHKKIYTVIFNKLRYGPLKQKDLLQLVDVSFIDLKGFQHIVTVMFPEAQFSIEMVQEKYPGIAVGLKTKDSLSWDDLVATHVAFHIKHVGNFPPKGKLYVNGTPPYDPQKGDTSNNAQALANTGQKNPDYMVVDKSFGTRYFDLKSGQHSPTKGHIIVRNNNETYAADSKILFSHHLQYFSKLGDEYADIQAYLYKLATNTTMDWATKNKTLQEFYFSNLQRLPNALPSFIFKCEPPHAANNMPYKDYAQTFVDSKSCDSLDNTQKVIFQQLHKETDAFFDNYQQSHGTSVVLSAIYKKLKNEFVLEILSS